MPSETFFRLPEEKRARLLEAAWEEFTRVRYPDVSISKIISRAGIPRGSFYQYFQDKEDLFRHLLSEAREGLMARTFAAMESSGGDLFDFYPLAFDRLMEGENLAGPELRRWVEVLRINTGLVPEIFGVEHNSQMQKCLAAHVDLSAFRSTEPAFLEQVFIMLASSLGGAIVGTLTRPETKEHNRAVLLTRLDIIRTGCLRPGSREKGGT